MYRTTIRLKRPLAAGLFALLVALPTAACDDDSGDACATPTGTVREMEEAKLYFEFQSTDNDTGIHGLFGGVEWAEMCIIAPDGEQFLVARPVGNLAGFGLSDIFFESREPPANVVSQPDVLALFPPGNWSVVGTTFDGEPFVGSALLTHDIPVPPTILGPADESTVDPNNLVVTWAPVTQSVAGAPVTISGYEIIVTNDDKDSADPNGMSQPILSAHVVPGVNSLTIPAEFLEPATRYELEVIAIEQSGNQTITVFFFETP